MNRQGEVLRGGRGYTTELAGRDRAKFFRQPVEPDGALPSGTSGAAHIRFAASCPSTPLPPHPSGSRSANANAAGSPLFPSSAAASGFGGSTRPSSSLRSGMNQSQRFRRPRPHHLPSLSSSVPRAAAAAAAAAAEPTPRMRDAELQTDYRENETQTDPYTPDYVIPDGAPEPEVLKLKGLTWRNGGLPAGKEEIELIQRVRRRRDVEENLPQGSDPASLEKRFAVLHELEELEWQDREEHVAKLQSRRLEKIEAALMAREEAREEANQQRFEQIKEQYFAKLRSKLETLQQRRMADSRRTVDRRLAGATTTGALTGSLKKRDLIASYAKYGVDAAPPAAGAASVLPGGATGGELRRTAAQSQRAPENYDVRPTLLSAPEGVEAVDATRSARIERLPESAFTVPENEAINRLRTLYERRRAEHVVHSLDYAYEKIQAAKDDGTATAEATQRVLELYRATPKLQRPPTPELELDGDAEETEEEACILLQRLLRGRAVQNDFFEGKERCRGLIEELQAASNAQFAERAKQAAKEREALVQQQEGMVQSVLDAALGDVISDTFGFLYQELGRQQDELRLDALRAEAEAVREEREAIEIARREAQRVQRDREEVQYAAYVRATDTTIECFLHDVYASATEEAAMEEAVREEGERQAARPSPPAETAEDRENLVCDLLDDFVIPAVLHILNGQDVELNKKAAAAAAGDAAMACAEEDAPLDPSNDPSPSSS